MTICYSLRDSSSSSEDTMPYTYQTAVTVAIEELQAAQKNLAGEIAGYPTPISGCDVQFNHLLSDRSRINNAIQALESHPFVATPRALEAIPAVECR